MKVAFLAKSHFDNTIPLVKELSEYIDVELIFIVAGNRHTESIFDFNFSNLPYGFIEKPKIVSRLLGKKYLEILGNSVQIKLFRFRSWRIRSPKNILSAFKLAQYLRTNSFDLMHINGSIGMFHLLYYFLVPGVTKVQTIHDSTSHSGEENLKKDINRYLLTKTKAKFILFSEYAAKDLLSKRKIPLARLHVIPFGPLFLHDDNFKVRVNPYQIIFWGRISPYKGIEYLIEAFHLVKKQIPEATLVIAGSGNFTFPLEDLTNDQSINIDNRYIPIPDLARYIQSSTVVVLPYTDATQSGVVMTAYAFAKPVVATEVGGLPEVVKHNKTGLLVPPRDSVALADAIIKILKSNFMIKQMEKNIKALCMNEFSWKKIAQQTLQVYGYYISK